MEAGTWATPCMNAIPVSRQLASQSSAQSTNPGQNRTWTRIWQTFGPTCISTERGRRGITSRLFKFFYLIFLKAAGIQDPALLRPHWQPQPQLLRLPGPLPRVRGRRRPRGHRDRRQDHQEPHRRKGQGGGHQEHGQGKVRIIVFFSFPHDFYFKVTAGLPVLWGCLDDDYVFSHFIGWLILINKH